MKASVATMRKSAIILASAATFDLGVMVVTAQAQEGVFRPSNGTSATQGSASDPSGPASQTRAVDMFIKIGPLNSVQACTARRGEVVRHEGVQQCRLPATGDRYIHKEIPALNFAKIDVHYTARACIAQRGEVVMRDGVQQCALPAEPGNTGARPSQR